MTSAWRSLPDESSQKAMPFLVVGAGFLIQLVMWGAYYSFGVFLMPLAEEMQVSRSKISMAYTLTTLTFGLGSVVSGRLTDKWGPRIVIGACCALGALGYALMSIAQSPLHAYIAVGLLGGIGLTGSYVPVTTAVAQWFDTGRGAMLGIVIAGNATGGMLGPTLSAWGIERAGWRTAYLGLGLIVGIACAVATLFVRNPPQHSGGRVRSAGAATQVSALERLGQSSFLRSRSYWIICGIWCVHGLAGTGFLAHYYSHMLEEGLTGSEAAPIVGAVGTLGILGGALGGVIGDRVGVVRGLVGGFACTAVVFGLLVLTGGRTTFWIAALFFGFNWFGIGVLVPLLVSRTVPAKQLGASIGFLELVWAAGGGIGPAALAWIYDGSGAYGWGWAALAVVAIATAYISTRIRKEIGPPSHDQGHQP